MPGFPNQPNFKKVFEELYDNVSTEDSAQPSSNSASSGSEQRRSSGDSNTLSQTDSIVLRAFVALSILLDDSSPARKRMKYGEITQILTRILRKHIDENSWITLPNLLREFANLLIDGDDDVLKSEYRQRADDFEAMPFGEEGLPDDQMDKVRAFSVIHVREIGRSI